MKALCVIVFVVLASPALGQVGGWTVTNLRPTGGTYSVAYAVRDGQQAGVTSVSSLQRASVWSGAASSWVDLNPVGTTVPAESRVTGVGAGQQGGWVTISSV